MDRGDRQATVHGVTKSRSLSQTRLSEHAGCAYIYIQHVFFIPLSMDISVVSMFWLLRIQLLGSWEYRLHNSTFMRQLK